MPALLTLSACASMIHGTTQEIGFSSSPSKAKVIVDGKELGVTPLVAELDRGREHVVRIERDGYQPFQWPVTRSMSPWILENWFVMIVPALVDIADGAMWNLAPDLITAQLAKSSGSSAQATPGGVHVNLVKRSDAGVMRAEAPPRR
jgi:hypothetical protein